MLAGLPLAVCGVAPQQLAVFGVDAHEPLLQELDVLFHAAGLDDDDRRIGRVAPFLGWDGRLPHDAARRFVERHDRGFAAARRANHAVAVDQRRLRVGPVARLAVKLAAQVLHPADRALGHFQTGQVAVRAQGPQQLAVDAGRRARTRILRAAIGPDLADPRGPNLLAARAVQALDEFVFLPLVAHQVQLVAAHRGRRIAASRVVDPPHQSRTIGRPLPFQPGLLGNAVTFGSAPGGPIGRTRRHGNRHQSHGHQQAKRFHPAPPRYGSIWFGSQFILPALTTFIGRVAPPGNRIAAMPARGLRRPCGPCNGCPFQR